MVGASILLVALKNAYKVAEIWYIVSIRNQAPYQPYAGCASIAIRKRVYVDDIKIPPDRLCNRMNPIHCISIKL